MATLPVDPYSALCNDHTRWKLDPSITPALDFQATGGRDRTRDGAGALLGQEEGQGSKAPAGDNGKRCY